MGDFSAFFLSLFFRSFWGGLLQHFSGSSRQVGGRGGGGGGGGGFASELCLGGICCFCLLIQHALQPLDEVRRIDVRSTAADPCKTMLESWSRPFVFCVNSLSIQAFVAKLRKSTNIGLNREPKRIPE